MIGEEDPSRFVRLPVFCSVGACTMSQVVLKEGREKREGGKGRGEEREEI